MSRDSTFEGSLNSFDSADFEVVWWGPKEQARLMMGCGPRQGYNLFQTERSAMTDEIQQMLVWVKQVFYRNTMGNPNKHPWVLDVFFFSGVAARSMVENLLADLCVLRMITIHPIPNSWLRMHGVVPPLIGCCCQAQLSDVGRFGGCHRPTKSLTPLPVWLLFLCLLFLILYILLATNHSCQGGYCCHWLAWL